MYIGRLSLYGSSRGNLFLYLSHMGGDSREKASESRERADVFLKVGPIVCTIANLVESSQAIVCLSWRENPRRRSNRHRSKRKYATIEIRDDERAASLPPGKEPSFR